RREIIAVFNTGEAPPTVDLRGGQGVSLADGAPEARRALRRRLAPAPPRPAGRRASAPGAPAAAPSTVRGRRAPSRPPARPTSTGSTEPGGCSSRRDVALRNVARFLFSGVWRAAAGGG